MFPNTVFNCNPEHIQVFNPIPIDVDRYERIMALGGISIAMAPDVAEMSKIQRPPKGREDVPSQLARLLEAHEIILRQAHEGAASADEAGDDGTNDMLVSNVIRTNEPQVWFVAEHLAATQLVA